MKKITLSVMATIAGIATVLVAGDRLIYSTSDAVVLGVVGTLVIFAGATVLGINAAKIIIANQKR
jgi:hypothetical protein